VPDESEKAPESGLRAPALEQSGAGSSQEPLPPAPPIGDTTCTADGSADASPTGTLADCVELMFLSAADDVVASGIPPTHSVNTNKLMEDVGVAVDHLFDGLRRPKIPRGSGFLDKMEARAYVLADRIGHGLLPPILPPDPQNANAIGKRAHKQVGTIASRQNKAKTALAAATRKVRESWRAGKPPYSISAVEEELVRLESDAAAAAADLDNQEYDLKLPPAMRVTRKRKAPPSPRSIPPDPVQEAITAYKLQKKAARAAKANAILAGAAILEATRRLDKARKVRDALGEKPDIGYFIIEPQLGICSDRECKKRAFEEEKFDDADIELEEAVEGLEEAAEDGAHDNENVREEMRKLQSAWAEVERVGACQVACQDEEPSQ